MNKNANAMYWEERMVNIFLDGEKDVLQVSKELKAQYTQAVKNIEDEILKFYGKYQTASGLDMRTIKKQLNKEELKSFHNTLDEIIEYAKNHQMDKDYKLRMKLLNMKNLGQLLVLKCKESTT
jgi:dipeptidase